MSGKPSAYSANTAFDSTSFKPYLTLSHRLSLTWLAYPILSLIFVAFRLQISSAAAQDAVTNAKGNLLTSCLAAQKAATAAASLPRYMAIATNQRISDGINDTLNGSRAALILALTIMEGVLNFVIDTYRSTFFCFLELVVRGGLAILIGAVQEFNTFLTATFSSIRTNIQNDVTAANSVIASAVGAVNKVNPFGDISVPQFSIPSLSALQNVTLPTDFVDALTKLNNTLPSIDQLKNAIEDIVDAPFEELKSEINSTFSSIKFNSSLFTIPEENQLSFCGDMDTSVVDDLGRDLLKAAKIGSIILVFLALLLLAGHCFIEWYKWRSLRRHYQYTREAWMSDPAVQRAGPSSAPTFKMTDHNLLILSADSAHPLLTRLSNQLAAWLRLSPMQFIKMRWFFHYVFHPPALACFLIGFFGLLSVEIQLIAIKPLEARFSDQVASSIADFSNTIVTNVNASMFNQSSAYATSINTHVDAVQTTINDGVFGWVNSTTSTLNNTLVTFYSDVQKTVDLIFGGTILENPAQDFVRCIIGTKVEALENALTFLHDNLHVDFPLVNESVLVLPPDSVDEVTRPISVAAIGGGEGSDGGLVGRLIDSYISSLKKERVMFGVFMGLWGIVVFMATCILLYHSYGKGWVEAYKKRKWQKEQRGGINGLVVPFRLDRSETPDSFNNVRLNNEKPNTTVDIDPFPTASSARAGFFCNFPLIPKREKVQEMPVIEKPQLQQGQSWDSFIDVQESRASAAPKPRASRIPRKLTGVGRKAMGREILVSDEKRAEMDAAGIEDLWGDDTEDERPREKNWFRRTFSRSRPDDVVPDNSSNSSRSGRPKPNLTIATDLAIPRATLPVIENNTAPASAWSISPAPPRAAPWLSVNARSPPIRPPGLNHNHNANSNSAPQPFYNKSRNTFNAQPVAIPVHYSSSRPPIVPTVPAPLATTPTPIYNTFHSRQSSNPPPPPPMRGSSPPRFSNATPRDSMKNPFDDDARVPVSPRRGSNSNPFLVSYGGVAL